MPSAWGSLGGKDGPYICIVLCDVDDGNHIYMRVVAARGNINVVPIICAADYRSAEDVEGYIEDCYHTIRGQRGNWNVDARIFNTTLELPNRVLRFDYGAMCVGPCPF